MAQIWASLLTNVQSKFLWTNWFCSSGMHRNGWFPQTWSLEFLSQFQMKKVNRMLSSNAIMHWLLEERMVKSLVGRENNNLLCKKVWDKKRFGSKPIRREFDTPFQNRKQYQLLLCFALLSVFSFLSGMFFQQELLQRWNCNVEMFLFLLKTCRTKQNDTLFWTKLNKNRFAKTECRQHFWFSIAEFIFCLQNSFQSTDALVWFVTGLMSQ